MWSFNIFVSGSLFLWKKKRKKLNFPNQVAQPCLTREIHLKTYFLLIGAHFNQINHVPWSIPLISRPCFTTKTHQWRMLHRSSTCGPQLGAPAAPGARGGSTALANCLPRRLHGFNVRFYHALFHSVIVFFHISFMINLDSYPVLISFRLIHCLMFTG